MAPPTAEDVKIREATIADAGAIADIYNHYILNSIATFEEKEISVAEMTRRLEETRTIAFPWLVAEAGDRIRGYAYATRWNRRSAYRFTAEITVYLAPDHSGRGIGSMLYEELFANLRRLGIRSVIGGISLPNDASVALHEKFGMKKVSHFKGIGFKLDRWVDVGHWQGTL